MLAMHMNQQLFSMLRACVLALAAVAATVAPSRAATCGSLATALLPDVRVDLAQDVGPGAFVPPVPGQPAAAPAPNPYATLPSFCRVAATVRPSSVTSCHQARPPCMSPGSARTMYWPG